VGAAAPARRVPGPRDAGRIEAIGDRRHGLRRAKNGAGPLRRIGRIEIVDDRAVGIDVAVLLDSTVRADADRTHLGGRVWLTPARRGPPSPSSSTRPSGPAPPARTAAGASGYRARPAEIR